MKFNILIGLVAVVYGSGLSIGAPIVRERPLLQDKPAALATVANPPAAVASSNTPITIKPLMKLSPEQSRLINGPYNEDPLPMPSGVQRIHKLTE
jgi:hypothetical protein